jgi:hypothetical protein
MPDRSRASSSAKPELGAHPGVPVLGQGLGQLHGQPVQLEVLAVGVAGEQLPGHLRHPAPHGDHLEGDHVDLAGLLRPPEVGQAQVPVPTLAREGEAAALVAGGAVQHDEVLALGHGGK